MDVGMLNNNGAAAVNPYAAKETGKTDEAKKYSVTGRTLGQPKLSEEGKKYYEELKAKYHNMDFVLVSSDMKEMAKAHAGSFASPDKMVVLIDEEKIERMATDEEFRKHYEGIIASAQNQMPQIKQALGNSPNIKGIGMQVDDNGKTSFFAVMKESFDAQSEKVKELREKKKEAKKEADKKADKKERQEKLEELRAQRHKDQDVILYADSVEELKKKIEEYNYNYMADTVRTDAEKYLGNSIDFRG